MKRWATIPILIALWLLVSAAPVMGQGVTTSTIRGQVVDATGETLPGANVIAVHEPSGTQYGTSTNESGRYVLPNLRVGGPYTITASFVGFQSQRETNVQLALGEKRTMNFELREQTAELDEVEVVAERGAVFDSERTGLSNNISEEDINNAPSVGRELADFARLTPQAIVGNDDDDGSSISIAGQNNRYNSIFIDGAVSNDVFGLSAQGTDGGQTGATPISIDAIQQFQIDISPYDVTQSFFGGGAINAVTRSGTNEFKGSVAYFRRDENFSGDLSTGDAFPEFSNDRYVARFGGPILEDKLFFFVNADILRRSTPQPFVGFDNFQGGTIASGADVDQFTTFLQDVLNYDPGQFGTKTGTLDSEKYFGKIDWNITQSHRLSARYNYTQSDNVDAFRSTRNTLAFSSRNEVFPNTTQIAAIELNSTIGSRFSNKAIVSYKSVEDDRNTNLSDPFPTVNIDDGPAEIQFGGEPFSTVNFLEQEVITFTNDFNAYFGNHTITVGTHNEFYDLTNKFVPFNNGWYFYDSVDDFRQSACAYAIGQGNSPSQCAEFGANPQPAPVFVLRGFSLVDDDPNTDDFEEVIGDATGAQGAFNAYIFGFYVQDEWQVSDRVRLTGGIRVDVPVLPDAPRFANPDDPLVPNDPSVNPLNTTVPDVQQYYNLRGALPGETPSPSPHWAPRFGFNYDIFGDKSTQLRGGLGVFTSRQPFVWPGGMYLNNGTNTGEVGDFGAFEFRRNPQNGLTVEDTQGRDPSSLIPAGRLEMFEDDYMLPRFMRYSLGLDQRLPGGWVATLEGQYTNTLQNILVTNVNLLPANETMDGPDNRPIWDEDSYDNTQVGANSRDQFIDGRYSNIHRVGNTDRGYAYDVTARLRNTYEVTPTTGLGLDVSYTYGDSWVVNDGTSSQINSLWDGVEHVNGANNVGLSRSDFSIGHRILGRVNVRQQLGRNAALNVALVYDGQSGRPFSYVIDESDALVNENGDPNSLLYVPRSASQLTFQPTTVGGVTITPEQQAAALEQFISENDYLSTRRGTYADRNADRTPFEGVFDLNFHVEVFGPLVGSERKLELTADIFNVSDMLGDALGYEEWGDRFAGFSQIQPTTFQGYVDAENGDFTPIYTADGIVKVENGEFAGSLGQEEIFDLAETGSTYSAQWQMRFGVRVTF